MWAGYSDAVAEMHTRAHACWHTRRHTWAEKEEEKHGGWRETGTESEVLSGCRSEEDQSWAEAKTETTHQPDQTRQDLTTTAKQVRYYLKKMKRKKTFWRASLEIVWLFLLSLLRRKRFSHEWLWQDVWQAPAISCQVFSCLWVLWVSLSHTHVAHFTSLDLDSWRLLFHC